MNALQTRATWNCGCIISAVLFALGGLPLLALLTIGERECDVVKSAPPCTIGWFELRLFYLAVVVAICIAVGWLANFLLRRPNDDS